MRIGEVAIKVWDAKRVGDLQRLCRDVDVFFYNNAPGANAAVLMVRRWFGQIQNRPEKRPGSLLP